MIDTIKFDNNIRSQAHTFIETRAVYHDAQTSLDTILDDLNTNHSAIDAEMKLLKTQLKLRCTSDHRRNIMKRRRNFK